MVGLLWGEVPDAPIQHAHLVLQGAQFLHHEGTDYVIIH